MACIFCCEFGKRDRRYQRCQSTELSEKLRIRHRVRAFLCVCPGGMLQCGGPVSDGSRIRAVFETNVGGWCQIRYQSCSMGGRMKEGVFEEQIAAYNQLRSA